MIGSSDSSSNLAVSVDRNKRNSESSNASLENKESLWPFGIEARPFLPWNATSERELPCYPSSPNWIKGGPINRGLIFVKTPKAGSSTGSGIHLRIASNVWRHRHVEYQDNNNSNNHTGLPDKQLRFCQNQFMHIKGIRYAHRDPLTSWMWGMVRDPTARTISQFFHFHVSRFGVEPTDDNILKFLRKPSDVADFQIEYLRTSMTTPPQQQQRQQQSTGGDRVAAVSANNSNATNMALPWNNNKTHHNHTKAYVVQSILHNYNFLGVTERMDETAVAIQMLLGLQTSDVMFLKSAKSNGNYDGGQWKSKCFLIQKSFVSPKVREYLDSPRWKQTIYWDKILHEVANRSLDMTIDMLGREEFDQNLKRFRTAQAQVWSACSNKVVYPCSDGTGERTEHHDCVFADSGCGFDCMNDFFENWNGTNVSTGTER